MVKGLILLSLAVLVASAYLDNLRGPLIPHFVAIYDVTFTTTALFLVFGHLAAVGVNLGLSSIVNKTSERNVSFLILIVAAAAPIVAFLFGGKDSFLFLGTLWGAAVSALGSLCNLLLILGTSAKTRSRFFSGLHMMYGFGSLLGPPVVAFVLDRSMDWRWSLYITLPILVLLGVGIRRELPSESELRVRNPKLFIPKGRQWLVLASFFMYVGTEVFVSMWMTTYLTRALGTDLAQAAKSVSGFFFFMGVTRLLCFIFYRGRFGGALVVGSLVFSAAVFLWGTARGIPAAICLAGVMGPWFPVFLGIVNENFEETATELTFWVLSAGQLSQAAFHLSVGRVVDRVGIERTYPMAGYFLLFTALVTASYLWVERRRVRATALNS